MSDSRTSPAWERWPSAYNFVAGLAFAIAGRFTDPNAFVSALESEGALAPGTSALVALEELRGFVETWGKLEDVVSQGLTREAARRHVLAVDVSLALELAERVPAELLSPDSVEAATDQLMAVARNLSLDVEYARLRVVEEFPEPHSDASFAAMTYDRGDQRLHDIEPGVVLLRDQLRPLYSIGLLAHEFTHLIIGRVDTDILARGLEEGIADLVGQLLLARNLMPQGVCERLLWNSRSRYGRDQLGRLYRDGLLGASALYLALGDEGMLDLLQRANNEGRQVIHDVERKLAAGVLASETRGAEGEFRSFAQSFVAMTPDLVVSPLAYVMASQLAVHEDVTSMCSRLNIDAAEAAESLEELQSRVFLAVESEGVITSNEGPFYAELGQLRYDAEATGPWSER
jgi:hypothetical protein